MSPGAATLAARLRLPEDLSEPAIQAVVDAIVRAYVYSGQHDGGVFLGCAEPSVVTVGLAAKLFCDREIDQVVVLTEVERTLFWTGEFERYTDLSTLTYYGASREAHLDRRGVPQVLVSTHETLRPELALRAPNGSRSRGTWTQGPLVARLGLSGKHTLWVFDGIDKLAHRSTETNQGYEHLLRKLREHHRQRVVALTTQPIEDDPERTYNLGRLLLPRRMPSVAEFEKSYCARTAIGRLRVRPERIDAFCGLFRGHVVN